MSTFSDIENSFLEHGYYGIYIHGNNYSRSTSRPPGSIVQLMSVMGWWCSGIVFGLLRRRSGVQFPDPPTLEKCAKGICLCNLLRSTQPNDRETVIEG